MAEQRTRDPRRDEAVQVQGCEVYHAAGKSIFIKLPDGEEYSVGRTNLFPGSIDTPGQKGALIVKRWVVDDALKPGTPSHQPTWRKMQEEKRAKEAAERDRQSQMSVDDQLDTVFGPESRPAHRGRPREERERGRADDYGAPPTSGSGVQPPVPVDGAKVSRMAEARLAVEREQVAQLERLGDIVLCLGVAWLTRNEKDGDGLDLRMMATRRLASMMGRRS